MRILLLLLMILSFNALADKDKPYTERSIYDNYDDAPKPYQRYIWQMQQRAFPYEYIPENAYQNAVREKDQNTLKLRKSRNLVQAQQPEWTTIGPYNIGGRVRTITVHPTDPNILWIGAASGGIWKSTDGGVSWEPKFDFKSSITMGAICVDPNNPDILFAGTGEGAQTSVFKGSGMYKSTDAGETWNLIGLTEVSSFNRLFIHPKNSNFIITGGFGRGAGVWRSTDGGDTWENTFDRPITDLSINEEDENEFLVGINADGIYITKDGGESYNRIAAQNEGGLNNDAVGRISVQFAQSNPNIIWALMERGAQGSEIGYVYKSNNRGLSWTQIYGGTSVMIFGSNRQGFYNNVIQPNPVNPDHVFVGGVQMYQSENGSVFFSVQGQGNNVHVDQHAVNFAPSDPNIVYVGNDGGVYKSTNGGTAWLDMNKGLEITQFYGFSVDQTRANVVYGGTQDNSTLTNRFNEDQYQVIWGGDGFETRIEIDDPDIVYGQSQYGNFFRRDFSKNEVISLRNGLPAVDANNFLFGSPLEQDYFADGWLYTGGKTLYLNTGANSTSGGAWRDFGLTVSEFISAIEPSKTNEINWFVGTSNAELYLGFENDGGDLEWKRIGNGQLPQRFIIDIETCPETEELVYVSFSGFGTQHIYKSTDNGDTWVVASNGLPNVPVNQLVIDRENVNNIYAATDIGVFVTYNQGNSWLPFGNGMPTVMVSDLEIHYNEDGLLPGKTLRASTYGRSIWEAQIPDDNVIDQAILQPYGGELVVTKTNLPIRWEGFTPPVKVEYSVDDGLTWEPVIDNLEGNVLYWRTPNRPTDLAKVRVTSLTDPSQVEVSYPFALRPKTKGSILSEVATGHIPYGIALDTQGFLWSTSFYSNELFKYRAATMEIVEKFTLKYDSLYTDIAIDEQNNRIYMSKLNSTLGGGGRLEVRDLEGNLIEDILHPFDLSSSYPIGTALLDGYLVLSDRDGDRAFRIVDPQDDFQFIADIDNPCQFTAGPRGMSYDGSEYMYHVCMNFGGGLSDANLYRLSKQDLTFVEEEIKLQNATGLINARGVAFDPIDKNIWISDFNGNIYKIAGFETVSNVEDEEEILNNPEIDAFIYPNPVNNFSNVSIQSNDYNGRMEIKIVDMMGRTVGTLFEGNTSTGNLQNFNIKAEEFESGMYNLIVITDGRIGLVKKFIVNR